MTSPSIIHDHEHWRQRAEEARAIASQMDPESRRMMLTIAESYDKLAQRAEERAGKLPQSQ
jgi:hypothetical protein